jgi:H+/Cl- antiporter ClcA
MRNVFSPKRFLPLLVAGVAGVFVLVHLLGLRRPGLDAGPIGRELIRWTVVLTAIALLAGILNVATQHVRRVFRRHPSWLYSLALLGGMTVVLIAGAVSALGGAGRNPLASNIMQSLFTYI